MPLKIFRYADLENADLVVDAVYEGASDTTIPAEPLSRIIPGVGNMGGFRAAGRGTDKRMVVLYTSGEDADWRGLADGLHADERPMMIISERPRRLVTSLASRPAGTMLMTGAESDAGYKVALAVCQALRESALSRSRNGTRATVAAL